MHEEIIRQAAAAMNIVYRKTFAIREYTFAGSPSLVQIYQPLLQLGVVVACSDVNSANAAIEATRRNKARVCRHLCCPFPAKLSCF